MPTIDIPVYQITALPLVLGSLTSETLTLTDPDDIFFDIPDANNDNQIASIGGTTVDISTIQEVVGLTVVTYIPSGSIFPVITDTDIYYMVIDGESYYYFPDIPADATIVSVPILTTLIPGPIPLCLAGETLVSTREGRKEARTIVVGDEVWTKDNGYQAVRWVGKKSLDTAYLALHQQHVPVVFEPGSLGGGLPSRQMTLSPLHRLLISTAEISLMFGDDTVLVAAREMVNGSTIRFDRERTSVDYIHLMFDRHEIIEAEGSLVESFHPNERSLSVLDHQVRKELFELFPELQNISARPVTHARQNLKAHEGVLAASMIQEAIRKPL